MKLRVKLPLFTSITVLISISVIALFSILQFKKEVEESIKIYRVDETKKILLHLQDIVNISYSMLDNSYRASTPDAIAERYNIRFADSTDRVIKMIAVNMVRITLENLRVLCFGTDGYIWLNEFEKPYTVVMHPIKPEFEGQDKFFAIENTDKNVYEAFHDSIVAGEGEGRVTYDFYKPNSEERIPKLSWVKLYEPLGWVIGTGVYIDHIDDIVEQKTAELRAQIKRLIIGILIIGILLILLATLALYIFGHSITTPIHRIQNQLSEMAKGKIVSKLKIHRKDEVGQMKKSLDALITGFASYSQFADEIGQGNFESKFSPLSNDDILGSSLLGMRKSLKKAREKENIRLEENKKRQWAAEGITFFSDIIRNNSADLQKLYEIFIIELVNYIEANQGGIFLLNNHSDKKYLDLVSAIAYNRKKFLKKKIELGEGLIGACFMEKESIYISKLPQNYISIKSGLGMASPTNLLITPLIYENVVYGVIEIASFNTIVQHEIQFVENIARNLAVSISTSNLNS